MPRGIYDRSKNKTQDVVVPEVIKTVDNPVDDVPRGTIEQKPVRVRQYSTNRDHKGEGEPLCFNCGHRSDMHYIEQRWTEQKMARNLQGDMGMIEQIKRKPIYDGNRPCQHACLCKQYE